MTSCSPSKYFVKRQVNKINIEELAEGESIVIEGDERGIRNIVKRVGNEIEILSETDSFIVADTKDRNDFLNHIKVIVICVCLTALIIAFLKFLKT